MKEYFLINQLENKTSEPGDKTSEPESKTSERESKTSEPRSKTSQTERKTSPKIRENVTSQMGKKDIFLVKRKNASSLTIFWFGLRRMGTLDSFTSAAGTSGRIQCSHPEWTKPKKS